MKHQAPKSISPEAQQFIDTAPPLDRTDITPESIQSIRDETTKGFEAAVERVYATYEPNITETEIAGVPVQVVQAGPHLGNSDNIILYCFGGGFVVGDPTTDQVITVPLAHKTGAAVYVPHYRLAPEHPYPAATDDCFAVYQALVDLVGAERIAIAGESAGGNLALSVVVRVRDAGLPAPRAVALFSPFVDFAFKSDTLTVLDGVDPTLGGVSSMVDTYGVGQNPTTPALSPLYADFDSSFPPTLITTGTRDLLLSESARLSTRMRKAGVNVSLHVWEGMWHVFEFYPEIPEAQQSLDEVAGFLTQHFCEG